MNTLGTTLVWLLSTMLLLTGCATKKERAGEAYELARSYKYGRGGVDKNPERAFFYYHKSAVLGDCRSMREVGRRYLLGDGVEPELGQAVEWLDRCGEQDECGGHPYRLLGAVYKEGKWGASKDWNEAEYWYAKGASYGDATCLRLIGNMYEQGATDFPRDIDLAIEIYKEVWAMGSQYHNGARALIDLYCTCEDPRYRDTKAAVVLAEEVVEKNPGNRVCLKSLAMAYTYDGQLEKAETVK